MTWDGIERRKESGYMDGMRQDIQNLLVGMGKLQNELENITKHNTSFRDDVNKEVAKLEQTVYGNGHPGLTTKVAAIDTLSQDFHAHVIADRWGWGVFVTVLLALVGWIVFH